MGESDQALLSPIQLPSSEPSTLIRKRQVFNSRDSAFSNNSSPTNSSEGVNNSDIISMESDSPFIPSYSHTRMSSGISGISSSSPVPPVESPELTSSPHLKRKLSDASSLPALNSPACRLSTGTTSELHKDKRTPHTLPLNSSLLYNKESSSAKQKKLRTLPSFSQAGTYQHQRSPILNSKDHKLFHSESRLDSISSDHTPTDSTNNITISPSRYSLDGGGMNHNDGTII